jgi:hypothetical protein
MFSHVYLAEPRRAVGPLSISSLIQCLEDRIAVLREAGEVPILIGGLPELIEQAVEHLRAINKGIQ